MTQPAPAFASDSLLASALEAGGTIALMDESKRVGRPTHTKSHGWHVQIYCKPPGETRSKRFRIKSVPGYGRITTKEEAQKVSDSLTFQAGHYRNRTTWEIIAPYIRGQDPMFTFAAQWKLWVEQKKRDYEAGEITEQWYKHVSRLQARGLLAELWDQRIDDINKPALEYWVRSLQTRRSDLKGTTIRGVLTVVAAFLRHLHSCGTITYNPGRKQLPRVKVEQYTPKIPAEDDLRRVFSHMPVQALGIMLARSCMGLRPSEAERLDVGDLDLAKNVLRVPPSKTPRGRTLELHPLVREWLEKYGNLPRPPWEALFVNPQASNRDKRWLRTALRKALVDAFKAAGVEWVRPNEAGRHFFATRALNDGASLYVVKELLGHSSQHVTERYAKLEALPLPRVLSKGE